MKRIRNTTTVTDEIETMIQTGQIPAPTALEQQPTEQQPAEQTMFEKLKARVAEDFTREKLIDTLIALIKPHVASPQDWYQRLKRRWPSMQDTPNPIEEAIHFAVDLALLPDADDAEQRAPKDLIKATFALSDKAADPRTIESIARRNKPISTAQVAAYRVVPAVWALRAKMRNDSTATTQTFAELF